MYISIPKLLDSANGLICDNYSLAISSVATSILLTSAVESPSSVGAGAPQSIPYYSISSIS